ncbi:MAG: hypothetical protein HY077_02005 [Elusimicrobia bacterium]|nr:hypothetical protein [Elusimicrobiota bacterium]
MKLPLSLLFLSTWAGLARAQSSDSDFKQSLALPDAAQAPSVPGRTVDALGRPVSPERLAAYQRILSSVKARRFSNDEQDLLLAVLNLPPLPPGPFKDRDRLVEHFARAGVGLGHSSGESLAGSDLWRLVRAARAAAEAYKIPPAILLCLTFRESGFNRSASAWTTSAKGVAQLTNGAVSDTVAKIQSDPVLAAATADYARTLGAKMPAAFVGAPDVDALTREIKRLKDGGAPATDIERKKMERQRAIASHKDEPGHVYNIETNFGLGAAYLAILRTRRLKEVSGEQKGWLTAVAAYNQGIGVANALIYDVFKGPSDYNAQSLDAVFNPKTAARLSITPALQEEMLGEVGSVRSCALP